MSSCERNFEQFLVNCNDAAEKLLREIKLDNPSTAPTKITLDSVLSTLRNAKFRYSIPAEAVKCVRYGANGITIVFVENYKIDMDNIGVGNIGGGFIFVVPVENDMQTVSSKIVMLSTMVNAYKSAYHLELDPYAMIAVLITTLAALARADNGATPVLYNCVTNPELMTTLCGFATTDKAYSKFIGNVINFAMTTDIFNMQRHLFAENYLLTLIDEPEETAEGEDTDNFEEAAERVGQKLREQANDGDTEDRHIPLDFKEFDNE